MVEFDYRAPHAWLHVKVTGARREPLKRTAPSGSNPSRLTRDNVAADTLRPGDYVRVSGSPGRKREPNIGFTSRLSSARQTDGGGEGGRPLSPGQWDAEANVYGGAQSRTLRTGGGHPRRRERLAEHRDPRHDSLRSESAL